MVKKIETNVDATTQEKADSTAYRGKDVVKAFAILLGVSAVIAVLYSLGFIDETLDRLF